MAKTVAQIKSDRAALVAAYRNALVAVRDNEHAALVAALREDIAGGIHDGTASCVPSELWARGVLTVDEGNCYLEALIRRISRDGWA